MLNLKKLVIGNCAPFHQLATLSDTYKYSFYPRAIRTWNSVTLSLIPDSLDEFKAIISSMWDTILYCYILFIFILSLLDFIACSYIYLYMFNYLFTYLFNFCF